MSPNTLSDFWFALEQVAQPLWFWIVQGAVFTTATALLIIIFKLIFKNRISAKWRFLVWAILLIRLVFPVLPSAPFSVFNFAKMDEQSVTSSSVVNIVSQEGYYRQRDEPRYSLTFGENAVPDNNKPDSDGVYYSTNVHAFRFGEFFTVIWAAGALLLSVYFIIVLIIYRRGLKKKRRECDEETLSVFNSCREKLGIKRGVRLYFADTTPVLTGLFRPSIYIPDSYSEHELEAVLIHELCHLKHLDVLWSGIAAAVLCLNWYNPVIWVSFFIFKRDIELYCDERTLKFTGNKQSYAKLLLKTAAKNRYVLGTSSLQSGKSDVKRRIKFLAKFKKPKVFIIVIALVLIAAITAGCLTNANSESAVKNNSTVKTSEQTQNDEPNISYTYDSATQIFKATGAGELKPFDAVYYQGSNADMVHEKEIPAIGWIRDYKLVPNQTKDIWDKTITGLPKTIEIGEGVTAIGENAFFANIEGTGIHFEQTERVILPDSLKEIKQFAFSHCESLNNITLPKNLTELGAGAFFNCHSLKSVTIPKDVDIVNRGVFSCCESLEKAILSDNIIAIENYAFYKTSLKEISLPDGLCEIGDYAFYNCKFTTVTVPDTVFSIRDKALGYNEKGKIEGFTIKGGADTTAEWYAKANGFKFEVIDSEELYRERFNESLNTQISDYYIETDNRVPLKVTETNDFSGIIDIIITTERLNPDFTLYDLSQMDKNLYFRKTASDKQPYYCIIEDTEYHHKAYLFFQKPDGYWICRDFIALDENGLPFDMRNGGEGLKGDNGNALLNLIAKVDR